MDESDISRENGFDVDRTTTFIPIIIAKLVLK